MKAWIASLKAKLAPELAYCKAHGMLLTVCAAAFVICALVVASAK